MLDGFGYVLGCSYDLETTQMIGLLNGKSVVFGVGIPGLAGLADKAGISLDKIIPAFKDPNRAHLQHCLGVFREAIRSTKDTGFFCYPGIDTLRQFFVRVKNTKCDNASWEMVQLRVGR